MTAVSALELLCPRGALQPGPVLVFAWNMKLRNPLNAAWGNSLRSGFARSNEKKKHEERARLETRRALARARVRGADLLPCVVTMTRLGAGRLDDDGLAAAFKKIRDGIAAELLVDDGSRFVRFLPRQRKAPPGTHGIEIAIWRGNLATMWDGDE